MRLPDIRILSLGRLIAVLALVFSAVPAKAQDVIGTSIVGGKKIEILSDNTWRFQDRLGESCFLVGATMEFCGQNANWRPLANKAPQITAAFERESKDFAFFIVEQIGRSSGMNLDAIGRAIVENVANGMGETAAEVPVFLSEDVSIYGKAARRVALQARLDGVFFVLINTAWLEDDRSGQIFTYSYGDQIRPSDIALHEQVVGSVVFRE